MVVNIMSNPRWKSSEKPLFVRTIWTNGHHHAILYKNDPLVNYTFINEKYNRKKSALTTRTNPETKTISKDLMRVPTVSILLSDVRNLKHIRAKSTAIGTKSARTERTVTIEVIPSDPLKKYNVNREVCFDDDRHLMRIQQFKNDLSDPSSRSDDINPKDTIEKYNSLSNRVMVWLDLAAQNGEDIQRKISEDLSAARMNAKPKVDEISTQNCRGRIIPAHVCSKFDRKQQVVTYTSYELLQNEERLKIVSNIEATQKQYTHNLKKFDEINNNFVKGVDLPILSQIELQAFEEPLLVNNCNNPKKITKSDRNRRQLHIFIPNVPKKLDCESLSSKSSSLLLKSKV